MILAVDNGSSYTDVLVRELGAVGDVDAMSHDAVDLDNVGGYSHYILSGRRRNNEGMNTTNAGIIKFALANNKPLLGICYGAEMLALVAGGTIRRMPSRAQGRCQVYADYNPLCSGTLEVYERHAYEIARIPPPLVSVGRSASCANEIIRYGSAPIYGVQFHPEMTPDGITMIRRFVSQA